MWIIDVGRRNTFEAVSINNCPPKLVVYDLVNEEVGTVIKYSKKGMNAVSELILSKK